MSERRSVFTSHLRGSSDKIRSHNKVGKRLFSFLFAVGIALFLCWGTAISVNSQQPTSRQELEAEIKQYAARHAKKGEAKTDRILSLYRDNKVGLTPIQIEEIYEAEFERLKVPRSPLEELPEWVVLVIGAVVTLLITSLREQVARGINKIWEWFYQRLAGSVFLRNIALRRYRQRIIEKHGKLFIPFRPQRPLEMDQVYVALRVVGNIEYSLPTGVRSDLDALKAVQNYPRLMVTGTPGSGKTMLLKYLLLIYAQGRMLSPGFPVPILLELHRISNLKLTQGQLIQELVKAFERYGFPQAEGFVKQSLKQGKLILLLDGLDEVNRIARSHVVQCIKDLLSTYPDCRMMITCRTMVYGGEFNPPITNRILNVVDLSDQQVQRFLKAWETEMPPERSLDQLLQTLRDRPRIMALARNPLLLTIIAFLYTDTPFELPHSRADFYQESTHFLLGQWHHEHNQYKANEKKLVLQHLALYNQDHSTVDEKDRRSIDYSTVLREIQAVLPGLNRKADIDTLPLLTEIVERSGLLLRIDGGNRYQFAHLTLQEYFAAEALREDEAGLLQRFRVDSWTWREVVKLWCGVPSDSTKVIETVYQQDEITGFECLADAVDVQESVAEKIIHKFMAQIERAALEDTIAQAFGNVASNFRPRGQAVFQFLIQVLADSSQQLPCRQGAANALSTTNLPQAVTVLAQHYSTAGLNLRDPLVRMGNLAVPGLIGWASSEQFWREAMADLATIGTAEAAQALVTFLWDRDKVKATQVAWHLGTLFVQNAVEESLQEVSLTMAQRQSASLDWVWSPFRTQADSESALPVIAGRIAYLIGQTDQKDYLQPIPILDPRLAIPVCGIALLEKSSIPRALTTRAEALLEQSEINPELEKHMIQELEDLLRKTRNTKWGMLLSSLRPRQQLDLLARLINAPRLPNQEDWRHLFQYVKYDFKSSWHYLLILCIALTTSLMALIGMYFTLIQQPNIGGFIGFAALIILTFWILLLRGIEEWVGPTIFMKFGLSGPLTFSRELGRFLIDNLVWGGGQPLYRAVAWAGALGVAVAVAVAGTLLGSVAGSVAVVWTVAVAVAVVVAWIGIGAGALALAVALAVALTVIGAITVAITSSTAVAITWPVTISGILSGIAGYGVGILGEERSNQTSKFKFMAIFAFPYFCGLPIIVIFSTLALSNILSWPIAILIELCILSLCTILWRRGQTLYQRSQNPLHGILDVRS